MKKTDLTEHQIDSQTVFKGALLDVKCDRVRLPDGSQAGREYIIHPGAVMIIPILDNGKLLMERQYRYPAQQDFFEFPAGKIDSGEDSLTTAKRELLEETGYVAKNWEYLIGVHTCIAYSNEKIDLFFATELSHQGSKLDDGEFLEIIEMPLEQAFDWMRQGKLTDVKTVLGLFLVEKKLTVNKR